MQHDSITTPEMIADKKNEFFIVQSIDPIVIKFKKATIKDSSINYTFASFITEDLFVKKYWYCFEKNIFS